VIQNIIQTVIALRKRILKINPAYRVNDVNSFTSRLIIADFYFDELAKTPACPFIKQPGTTRPDSPVDHVF